MADSIRTKIRKALIYGVKQITTSNGYDTDVGGADAEIHQVENMLNSNFVNVSIGTERYDQERHTNGYITKYLPVSFQCYVESVNGIREETLRVLSGLEEYFGVNREIPDEEGNGTVVGFTEIGNNVVRGTINDSPYYTVSSDLLIVYHQSLLDPASTDLSTSRPSFGNSPPADVSISRRETLRDALVYNLKKISTSSGYNYDIGAGNVVNGIPTRERLLNFPTISVSNPVENTRNRNEYNLQGGLLWKEADFPISIYCKSIADPLEDAEKGIADVEKVIMNNFTLPDSDGNRTCTACTFVTNRVREIKSNNPYAMVDMVVRCRYFQERSDPKQVSISS